MQLYVLNAVDPHGNEEPGQLGGREARPLTSPLLQRLVVQKIAAGLMFA